MGINSRYREKTDAELLGHFYDDRDNAWLGILLERYTMLLFGVCMKYLKQEDEAKDAVQQVFLKVLHELQKYKVEYFKSWIYMIAKNQCLMKLREKGRFTAEVDERFFAMPDEKEEKIKYLEKEQNLDHLGEALQELNEDQQLCITQFYLQKKSYQQVAEETGFNLMQVKSHIQNGKRNLRIAIENRQEK